MSEFDDREEFYRYLDYLLYEMSWIKETSATMQKEIQTWMVYHHIEVQQEKAKMEQILREENTKLSDSMSTLLATSSALRERSDNSQIEDILVRQRI